MTKQLLAWTRAHGAVAQGGQCLGKELPSGLGALRLQWEWTGGDLLLAHCLDSFNSLFYSKDCKTPIQMSETWGLTGLQNETSLIPTEGTPAPSPVLKPHPRVKVRLFSQGELYPVMDILAVKKLKNAHFSKSLPKLNIII